MKYAVYIIVSLFSMLSAEARLNVLLFNFNDSAIDLKDEVAVNLSNQISSNFIDIMKSDMSFIEEINFIPSNKLEKQRSFSHSVLLDEINRDLNNGFTSVVSKNRIIEIIKKASGGHLSDIQMNSLVDSILFSISDVTKGVTKKMMDINTIDDTPESGMNVSDLYNFINGATEETLKESTFSSLITSSNIEFDSDIIVVGNYSISDNKITMNMFLYNHFDFSLIDMISASSSMDKANILIKDMEFKLLSKLGVILDDSDKEILCRYDANHFSWSNYSLYFSEIFHVSDIKEVKYRLQIADEYNLVTNHHESFLTGLMNEKIEYKIKFYGIDNYYRVFSTESVTSNSVLANVLKSTWHGKMGAYSNSDYSESNFKNSKTVIEINYDQIEAIYFKRDRNPFSDLLKQISMYSLILALGFSLGMIL